MSRFQSYKRISVVETSTYFAPRHRMTLSSSYRSRSIQYTGQAQLHKLYVFGYILSHRIHKGVET